MPDVLIETREGWLAGRGAQFMAAIQDAISATLRTPVHDKILRLVQHARDDFAIPDWAGERFTHIEITMFPGRTVATKRALYKAIVENLQRFGVPANDVKIILIEVPRENVGMRGGHAASDFDIGYETAV
ncbi:MULTISPECIES: tautomerase family protein [unclassified Bradyrhizobium]|uniref:tautomerase family protein n=1 Tax=unclassified Bradyrhizobium TaxID=2631580 RepID=UPI002478511F|nr:MULTISPECIES: tautomerase family protein [unclassified Bradyrhizobium]WGS20013.1 tautomerase family protein [Bradyrhizobium sp. ISRA463]WGS26867.1 tautomerase family protein [Bradyrhizobium sp. ISRA464]